MNAHLRSVVVALAGLFVWCARAVAADPVAVASADLRVTFITPTHCRAVLRYRTTTEAGGPIDHRLRLDEGTTVIPVRVGGAAVSQPIRIGSTMSVSTDGRGREYELAYEVRQQDAWRFRCPVWLPVASTSGGPTAVRLSVTLPEDARPVGTTFPSLSFDGTSGRAAMRDVPSLVRVAFEAPGVEPAWSERLDAGQATDAAAVALLAIATGVWIVRRRR